MNNNQHIPTAYYPRPLTVHQLEIALRAYCLGDRFGAPWEGQRPNWTPTPWEDILSRFNKYSPGTDESDTVVCFQRFASGYTWQKGEKDFLVNWVRFHERNRRHTTYGQTWKDHFLTVQALDSRGSLSVEQLRSIALDRHRGGSSGNGCLALVLPVYLSALKLGLSSGDRHELVTAVTGLSHCGRDAQTAVIWLCHFLDQLRDDNSQLTWLDQDYSDSAALSRYLHRPHWRDVPPDEFSRRFPQNVLCGATLAHALYANEMTHTWKELVIHVVSMRGDVDSVLALALMLHGLIHDIDDFDMTFGEVL